VPTYQYACTECDHAFEQFQSFTEDALTVCPQCQGRLRKKYNAVGVVFKGSGFYRTDSRAATGAEEKSSAKNGETKESDSSPAKSNGKGAGDKVAATPSTSSASTSSSASGEGSAA